MTCDRRLMVPAWLIVRHEVMIFRYISYMGVAHVPVWEVLHVTVPLQVLLLLGGWWWNRSLRVWNCCGWLRTILSMLLLLLFSSAAASSYLSTSSSSIVTLVGGLTRLLVRLVCRWRWRSSNIWRHCRCRVPCLLWHHSIRWWGCVWLDVSVLRWLRWLGWLSRRVHIVHSLLFHLFNDCL